MYINGGLVLEALQFYKEVGYKLISVPCIVNEEVSSLTRPFGKEDFHHGSSGSVYVASAEQSFFQMLKDGVLGEGKFCAITPCFRDEDVDETHFSIFLKVELIVVGSRKFGVCMKDAADFMGRFSEDISFEEICENQTDILNNGIEVGSYGSRKVFGEDISYGTGLAEPRFSFTLYHQE